MLEQIDSWISSLKGKLFTFTIEKAGTNKFQINCCIDIDNLLNCLTYDVAEEMSRAEVEEYFENDATFLRTYGRD